MRRPSPPSARGRESRVAGCTKRVVDEHAESVLHGIEHRRIVAWLSARPPGPGPPAVALGS